MKLINLSDKPLKFGGSKEGLLKMIVLPDYSPARNYLPTGIVAVYDREKHNACFDYLGPDAGCGMALAKFESCPDSLEYCAQSVAERLQSTVSESASLGGGNHFIDFYEAVEVDSSARLNITPGDSLVLVHSGCSYRGEKAYEYSLSGKHSVQELERIARFGMRNRQNLLKLVENCSKRKLRLVLDKPHNTLELTNVKAIYRKGAVRLMPGEISIISSSMVGDAIIVQSNERIVDLECSMCHGTGRKISRSSARDKRFDFAEVRKRVFIPSFIEDEDIATEHPECYRKLEDIFPEILSYVNIVGRLIPKAVIFS